MSNSLKLEHEAVSEHRAPQEPAQQDPAAKIRRWKRGRRALLFGLLALVLLVPGSMGAYLNSLARIYETQTVKIENAFPPEAVRVPCLRRPECAQRRLPYMSVAPVLDAVEAGRLAFSLRDIQSEDTVAFTLPTAGIGTSADAQSAVLPDLAAIEEIRDALSEDRLGDYAAAKSLGNGK